MPEIPLSLTDPDFEGIRAKLQSGLAARDSWKGLLATQTGQTLIDFIATVGAFGQARGIRVGQDAFSETAVSQRAQYAIADMKGLRLTRKGPASISVTVAYTDPTGGLQPSVTIPAFTQFQAAGTFWINEEAVTISTGGNVVATFYQGYVVDQTVQGTGGDYSSFISPEKDFSVSDRGAHVQVFNGVTPIQRTTEGLWKFPGALAFTDRTTPDGRLHLRFGTDSYGYKPSSSDVVRIRYVVTSGADGNSVNTLTARMSMVTPVAGVTMTITTNPSGGSNPPTASVYKSADVASFGLFGAAVTPAQYRSKALEYPGIVDCVLQAQRELDPSDLTKMNTIRAIPLTSGPAWNTAQKNAFLDYMQENSMLSTRFYWVDPLAATRTIRVKVFCKSSANASECATDVQAAIQNLFAKARGILSFDIVRTDIDRVALASNPGVDYVDILEPTYDFYVSGKPMAAPSALAFTTGGSLPAGTYVYSVYAVDAYGRTRPVYYTSAVTTTGTSRVRLRWEAYPNATQYGVVGRTSGSQGIIALLSSSTLEYFDSSLSAYLPGTIPTAADYPIRYNSISSLTVTGEYSTRAV